MFVLIFYFKIFLLDMHLFHLQQDLRISLCQPDLRDVYKFSILEPLLHGCDQLKFKNIYQILLLLWCYSKSIELIRSYDEVISPG